MTVLMISVGYWTTSLINVTFETKSKSWLIFNIFLVNFERTRSSIIENNWNVELRRKINLQLNYNCELTSNQFNNTKQVLRELITANLGQVS